MKDITVVNLINFAFLGLAAFFLLTGGLVFALGSVICWFCVRVAFHLLAPRLVRYHVTDQDRRG